MARPSKKNFQTPKGTFDILPPEQKYWERVRKIVRDLAIDYNYQRIDTPIIENTELFLASVGQSTDIVEKQMYTLKTKGGDWLALRPEGTASVARSYLQNGMINLPHPIKLYYIGPMFRHEQPQSGRYRQFHQFGFEVLGDQDPIYDAQVINVFINLLKELGIRNLVIQVNSIGDKNCRPAYRKQLVAYYRNKVDKLCSDCKRRFKENPLRLFDCKEEKCIRIKSQAPHMLDSLCEECKNHFKSVLEFLDELGLPYVLNPYLVRGLDYYTKTVFEVFVEDNSAKKNDDALYPQIALGGGGRYDDLIHMLGNRHIPAIGVAGGIERIIGTIKKQNISVPSPTNYEVFLIQLGDLGKKKALKLFEDLRKTGIRVVEALGKNSIKSQLSVASRMGVSYALILGQQEALEGNIILRDMKGGVQETISLNKIVDIIKKKIRNR